MMHNPHTNNYMICAHLNEDPNQPCLRFMDKPVSIGDSGVFYVCVGCSVDIKGIPPDMYYYVTLDKTPDAKHVIEEVVLGDPE
jgi:hypothetical protein